MPLTDAEVRNAKPKDKPYKIAGGKGFYLLVNSVGKYFRFDYRFEGKRKTMALGVYPDLSLSQARTSMLKARGLLANKVDPLAMKQATKADAAAKSQNSFEVIAREWLVRFSPRWTQNHGEKILRRLEVDIFPWLGNRPVNEILAAKLLAALRRIEGRGAIETAHRAHQNCSQVFRYAVATGRADRDPCGDLKGALAPVRQEHHASITDPDRVGELLRALDGYRGSFVTRCALSLAPMLFVRPGELRAAEWSEFDLDAAEWRIPAARMKMRQLHIVPLSSQAVAILRELHPLTGKGDLLFPGVRSVKRPMSENTITGALRRLGYTSGQMTGHGFRSMASTMLHEQGWRHEAIERQLAHGERNKVSAAYNYAEHLPERRKMMQAWADYLAALRDGRNVIAGKFGRAA